VNTFKAQVPNGFMLIAGVKPKSKAVKLIEPVKSYGFKSDLLITFVQDKAATIADIALHFGWSKTATSSLANKIKRDHKVIKIDLQVINGRSIAVVRGINLEDDYIGVKA